jgi:hypothetical protein
MNVCGLSAWQALGALSSLRGGSYGECGPRGTEKWAQGLEIPWPAEQWLLRPMWGGLVCSTGCSFSKSWHGVQSADVSALPGALPHPRVSPSSQQSPRFTELRRSAAVSQSPSWIYVEKYFLYSPCLCEVFH